MANITTQTIRVDLSTDKVIPSAFTHQNDTARTLVFDMYNGGMPYTMTGNTVKFACKSPIVNGQYSVIAGASMASGTVSGNKVTVTLPSAYTAISGVGMLTMIITPTSGTVRPVNIRLVVQKSADGDDTVAGASDFPTTLQQIADEWYDENIANWLNENIESVYDAEAFGTAIDSWLDDHPEATTTVQDGAISSVKLANNAVTARKLAHSVAKIVTVASKERACCNILIDDEGHAIVFDLSNKSQGLAVANTDAIVNALSNYGAINVDAIVFSHYHWDHVGDLSTFLGRVPHEGCIIYGQPDPSVYPAFASVYDNYASVNNAVTEYGLTFVHPTENQTANIGNFKLTFNNCNISYWANIADDVDSAYNDTSIVTTVRYGNGTVLITGDIFYDAEKYLYDNELVHHADILIAPHHGLETNMYQPWINVVAPDVCIANFGTDNTGTDYIAMKPYYSAMNNYCNMYGLPMFDVLENGTFSIALNCSGGVLYNGLKSSYNYSTIENYPSIRDVTSHTRNYGLTSADTSIKDVLLLMPSNSKLECYISYDYLIGQELGLTVNAYLTITKMVGGYRNYLWIGNGNDFVFTIEITPIFEAAQEFVRINGRYVNEVWTTSIQKFNPINLMTGTLTKTDYTDTSEAFKISRGSASIGSLFTLDSTSKTITPSRTVTALVTIYSSEQSTYSDIVSFGNTWFQLSDGHSETKRLTLTSGTAYNFTSTANPAKPLYYIIDVKGTAREYTFPTT